jgi:outer membrane protein OmpA-like peptidoglycan-associated protein
MGNLSIMRQVESAVRYPMTRTLRICSALVLFSLLAIPATGWADKLSYRLKPIAEGKAVPTLLLNADARVKKVVITLNRNDGKTLTLSAKNLRPGKVKKVKVPQEVGLFTYKAHFHITWANKTVKSFTTQFTLIRVNKIKLTVRRQDVDLDTNSVVFRLSNPVTKAELTVFGESGKILEAVVENYDAPAPNTPLTLKWSKVEGKILKIELKVTDIAGFYTGVRITPFTIEIPHEEVVFTSGQYAIRKTEAPKLQDTMTKIREALAKHGTLLQLKLFVGGYTDTVGSKSYNRGLSARRARSIGFWFRRNGLRIAIYYQGFGEKGLAKKTPDETAEPANRRAAYILSSQKPGISAHTPRANWKKL